MKNTLILILVVLVLILAYFAFYKKEVPSFVNTPKDSIVVDKKGDTGISPDKKSILVDGKEILSVDNDIIFGFFKDPKNGMCDSSNINNTTTRKQFCADKDFFKSKTYFTEVVFSSEKTKIAFTVGTDELAPDTVVGIFYPKNTTYKVHMLTSFYLGNKFISFSPSEKNIVYTTNCFEGNCGLVIKDAVSLKPIKSLPVSADLDSMPPLTFIRWVSDNEIEYTEASVLKKVSF